jgi:hypothetical protein
MRRICLTLSALVLSTAAAGTAHAQGMQTTQPKFLHIVREQVKTGRAADHAKWEAGWPAAYAKAKNPYNYLALSSVTGPSEAWYVLGFASQAAYGESMAREDADASLRAELDRLSRGDAEFVSEITSIEALARPDLSYGAFPDLATMRFWEITTFRVKPGHDDDFAAAAKAWAAASERSAPKASWRTYEVVAGMPGPTFLVFSSYGSFADFDKAATDGEATYKGLTFEERTALQKYSSDATLSTVTNRFRLDPGMSYVPAETRQKDPAFWMPKPAASPGAKSAAKKPS